VTEGDRSIPPGEQPNLYFDPAGSGVAGFAGCNRFFGEYAFDGSRLTFSRLAATRKYCANSATLEATFLDALGRTRRAVLTDRYLELLDESGRPLLAFRAQEQA
jgi:heat shock protein HslJ